MWLYKIKTPVSILFFKRPISSLMFHRLVFRQLTWVSAWGSMEKCLTHEVAEPKRQVFFHRQQTGVMAAGQPLTVFLRTCKARSRVSVPASNTVHPQPSQVPRALRIFQADVLCIHFAVHASVSPALPSTDPGGQMKDVYSCSCSVFILVFFFFITVSSWQRPLRRPPCTTQTG